MLGKLTEGLDRPGMSASLASAAVSDSVSSGSGSWVILTS